MRKWIWIAAGFIAVLIAAFVWIYGLIDQDFDRARDKAIARALSESSLSEIERVDFFAGADDYVVIFGHNKEGESVLVWVGDNDLHEEKAADGLNASAVREKLQERQGAVDVIRVIPGKLGEDWVWEAFFKKQEDEGTRYYYEYYKFSDGEWLDTYRLNLEE